MNTPTENTEALAKLTELLRAATANLNPPTAPAFTTWGQPPSVAPGQPPVFGGAVTPTGLLIALTIPTPQGDVSAYLQLPAAALTNPQQTIAQLQAAGWPLRIFNRGGNSGYQPGYQSWRRRW